MKGVTLLLVLLLTVLSFGVYAKVRLPKLFGDGMVLQRNIKTPIWGWASPGEKITIRFNKQTKKIIAPSSGRWKVELNAQKEGGPYQLRIDGTNSIVIKDVLIGDVWICSGQSNMEFPVAITKNAKEEIKNANYPLIRYFGVPKTVSLQPEKDMNGGKWQAVTPAHVKSFTAVGYFFARALYQELNVPIGIISSNIGGTVIETWISKDAFEKNKDFVGMISKVPKTSIEELNKESLDKLMTEVDSAQGALPKPNEIDNFPSPTYNDDDWKTMEVPGLWETKGWPKLDGVVWFRKEIILGQEDLENKATLNVGSIDDSDETYINGVKIGETTLKPVNLRAYSVPNGVLKLGKNTIAIKIEDTGGGGGFNGPAEKMNLTTNTNTISLAGSWKYKIASVSKNGFAIYPNTYPTLLYNAMINPLIEYPIKGVIWYQGESNAFRAYQYRKTFPLLIRNWREKWNQGNFPFLFVQLVNFDASNGGNGSTWAELRESQSKTLSVPNTGMAVTIDVGEAKDIHPKNKQIVGKRLALVALEKVYKKRMMSSGPVYKSFEKEEGKIIISFTSLGKGLMVKDSLKVINGFTIAGADKKFVKAIAYVSKGKIVVYGEEVKNPVAVRYAWTDNPEEANLFNKDGFPAAPFRTDNWNLLTKDVVYQIGL